MKNMGLGFEITLNKLRLDRVGFEHQIGHPWFLTPLGFAPNLSHKIFGLVFSPTKGSATHHTWTPKICSFSTAYIALKPWLPFSPKGSQNLFQTWLWWIGLKPEFVLTLFPKISDSSLLDFCPLTHGNSLEMGWKNFFQLSPLVSLANRKKT